MPAHAIEPPLPVPPRRAVRWLVPGTVGALAMLAMVSRPRVLVCPRWTDEDVAKVTAMKYALEAYPEWAAAHPGRCPSLRDLRPWMERDVDPWSNPFRLECHGDAMVAISAGPDGVFGNDDDVRSDR